MVMFRLPLLALGAFLSLASPALAAQRYASPSSTDVVGSCSALAPCRLDHAVNDAGAGDEVIVQPGTYAVAYSVSAPVPVNLHGVVGQRPPRLVGASGAGDVVSVGAGSSVGYLEIAADSSAGDALDLDGGVGSALYVSNASGVGATLRGGALLRDTLVRVGSANPAMETKDGKDGRVSKLLNVTLLAPDAGAAAVKVKGSDGVTVIRNSIVRGGASDVSVYPRAAAAIDHSDFRPAFSSSYTDGGANSSADPKLGAGFVPHDGSPMIDAGTAADPDLGPSDPGGAQRVWGAGPDIGAFEYGAPRADWDGSTNPTGAGSGGAGGTAGNRIDPPTAPKAGKKVNVGPVSGSVKVRTPGGSAFVQLGDDASVPVGSVVDASHGVVELTSARGGGRPGAQTGRFWGGRFKVAQSARGDGYTRLVLSGGSFKRCTAIGRSKAVAAGRKRSVRRLWGQDKHGRFRSNGRRGEATVRGTLWLTEDRCDGTLFAVRKGAISVKAKGVRKAVLLRAGGRYLARAR
jgi:hypothetical protein